LLSVAFLTPAINWSELRRICLAVVLPAVSVRLPRSFPDHG
jgi:hypothetical protein